MTHIMLAAENESVGACWVEAYNPTLLKEAINPGENQLIFGIMHWVIPKPDSKRHLIRKGNPWKKSLILCELLFSVILSWNTLQEVFVTYGRYLFIRFISSFLSVGFEIYSLHPASIDLIRSPSIAYAVLAIIGISLLLSLIRLVVS